MTCISPKKIADLLEVLGDNPNGLHADEVAELVGWRSPKGALNGLRILERRGAVASVPDPAWHGSQTRRRYGLPQHVALMTAEAARGRAQAAAGEAMRDRAFGVFLPSSDPRSTPSRDRVLRDSKPPASIFGGLRPGVYPVATGSAIEQAYRARTE